MDEELDVKAEAFLKSRKNANNLIDIISLLEKHTGKADILKCISTLEKIFLEILQRREASREPDLGAKDSSPVLQYMKWLGEIYEETFSKFLGMIDDSPSPIQRQLLETMMKLLTMEGKNPLERTKPIVYYFPTHRVQQILLALLSNTVNTKHLVLKFQEWTKHPDVIYYSWKVLPSIAERAKDPSEVYVKNFLQLVGVLSPPKTLEVGGDSLCGMDDRSPFTMNMDHIKKWMSKTWKSVMRWQFTPANQRKMLILLLENVLTHLNRPLYLTDYLMNSLDAGGPIGVLALQGMLTLIQTYNLDYPNIYGKLYTMMEPNIFQMKYKPRLFHLTDLFLTSSHLPLQLVAAFVKRMARLTLVAPPQDVHIMLQFIGNLLIRHPALKKMLIASPSDPEKACDPYDMDENDPLKSHAIDSFLWEIYSLERHYLPSVATAANQLINSPLPTVEWDIGLILENTEDDIFVKELKKKQKEITLTYEKPFSMKLPHGEKLLDYWSLS